MQSEELENLRLRKTKELSEVTFLNKVVNMDWKDAIKLIPDKIVDLVVTDPPYGINFQSNQRKIKHKKIYNDNNLDWIESWIIELKRVCKDDAHLYIFCSWHNVEIFKSIIGLHFNIKNILIWEKNKIGMGDLYCNFAPKYEMILFCSNGRKPLNGGRDPNIIKFNRTKCNNHPTEKPVTLLKYLIEKSSQEGDIVIDTFAGSFATAIACKQIKRNFLCFEIDEDYCKKGRQLLNNTSVNLF